MVSAYLVFHISIPPGSHDVHVGIFSEPCPTYEGTRKLFQICADVWTTSGETYGEARESLLKNLNSRHPELTEMLRKNPRGVKLYDPDQVWR